MNWTTSNKLKTIQLFDQIEALARDNKNDLAIQRVFKKVKKIQGQMDLIYKKLDKVDENIDCLENDIQYDKILLDIKDLEENLEGDEFNE
ncbi:MAG: hypothetical protein WCG45_05540 [bacterium]